MSVGANPPQSGPIGKLPFRLEGAIPPRKLPALYRLALGITAGGMVLLVAAYVAIVVATAYGIYFYATHAGAFIFGSSGAGLMRLVIYVAPLFAGGVLIAFMIKPLFARPVKAPEPLRIDLEKEACLKAVIAEICAKVGSPVPEAVELDCQVNASARLRNGFRSLGRRDLVLTIGLPLTAGLSLRQFAGVLAHEFGHFSQPAGMGFTYVIHSINHWFARVVFRRDQWDLWLEEHTARGDYRIRLIMAVAQGALWVSRKLLHGLMWIGHVITCFQLRQMEYDADYYEVQLAGTADFAATMERLTQLSAANQAAYSQLNELWRDRRLVEDFPNFVAHHFLELDPGVKSKLAEESSKQKTGWLHTHPSNADRVAHAQRLNLPGIFVGDGSALEAFSDPAAVTRLVTRHLYRNQLGLEFDDSALVPNATAQQAATETQTSRAACLRLTASVIDLSRPLVWTAADFAEARAQAPQEAGPLPTRLMACRRNIIQATPAAHLSDKTFGSITDSYITSEAACAMLRAGIKINPAGFNLQKADLGEAESDRDRLRARLQQQAAEFKAFEAGVHRWITLLGQAGRTADREAGSILSEEKSQRIIELTDVLVEIGPWCRAFPEWILHYRLLQIFSANHAAMAKNDAFLRAFRDRIRQAEELTKKAPEMLKSIPYPFPHAGGALTVTDFLHRSLEGTEGGGRLSVLIQAISGLYFRLLGELAVIGEELESAVKEESASAQAVPSVR